MRIRKQPRRLPACGDDFLPCFFHQEGWTTREYLEVVNKGTVFSDKAIRFAGLAAHRTEQFVAAAMLQAAPKVIDYVKPDPNAITMSRTFRLQQTGDGRDIPVWVPQVLTAQGPKVEDGQEKSKVPYKGSKLPSLFALNLVGETPKTLVSCGESSSPSVDMEIVNSDQMKFPDPPNHLECYIQHEDDKRTRHYVRRGLRNFGDSVTQNPTGETIPVKDILATFSKTNSYERDELPYSEKVNYCSRHITRSAIPGDSNAPEDHPLRSPEGSLLHSLYLQLLAAGREGISLRGLYASFESQTFLPRFASNWREKVKTHLKNGPYFEEVKGRYILCEFLVQPSSKRTSKRKERSESLGVHTRRKAHQKTHETVLSASAVAFQKPQRQKTNDGGSGPPIPSLPKEAIQSDPDMTQQTPTKCISSPIQLSKPANEGLQISRNIRFGGAIPGSLKAMKARIIAETGVQVGVRCARKDGSNDSSKWQCPMMAMEGHTLCEHHSFLNERKRARYAKARRQDDSKIGKSLRSHLQENPAAPGVARSQRKNPGVRSSQAPRLSELQNSDSDDPAGLDEFASQALLTMKSDILVVERVNQDYPLYVPDFNSFQVDGSRLSSEESTKAQSSLASHLFARSPTGRFIAAKKTAVNIPALSLVTGTSLGKSSVSSTRPPSIPPLPAFYGPRRKTVKNRSLLSIN